MFHLIKTTVLPPMFYSINFESVTPYGFFMTTDKENNSVTLYVSFDKNNSVTPYIVFDKDFFFSNVFFHDDQ